MVITGFGDVIGERMRAEHTALAARWLGRLSDLLPVDASEVFPSDTLLDHIPALILDISQYLQTPAEEAIAANTTVLEKARELGALRHSQRASLHQVLREYQLLGGVLFAFVQEETSRLNLTPPPAETVSVVSRLHQAINTLTQATVETFVELYTRTIAEQAERLEQFTRMATHEWRQPLGSLQFAVTLLRKPDLAPELSRQTLDVIDRNVAHLIDLTRKIELLARIREEQDDPVVQTVAVGTVAAEAARQLREMAEARGVEIRIADELPSVTVDVGRLELTIVNLLSNGIKYSDPERSRRFVEIAGGLVDGNLCQLVVRDNGIGIPRERISTIFGRFSRAHADRDDGRGVAGMGLGLAIVDDCVRTMGGSIEVESAEGSGTTFVLTIPAAAAAEADGV